MANTLVTGAAGFIGSHVAEALLDRGDSVVCLDNLDPYYDTAIKRRNIETALRSDAYRFVEGDIRDAELVAALLSEHSVTHIIHLAAKAGVRPSLVDPAAYTSANVDGTVTLLEAARNAGVERFVFGSSSSVYGAAATVPFREDQDITKPISPYAASKVAAEAYCHTYHHLYEIPMVVLRFFTVYGPRQRPDLAINKFVHLMRAGEPITMFGDGTSSRDYTFVGDIVRGVLAASDSDIEFDIFNLGGSSPIRLIDLISTIADVVGVQPHINREPMQPGDVPRTYASIDKAHALLGWQPETKLEDGLRAYAAWLDGE